jgi:acyl-CoA thioester hydrolase
VSEIFCETIRVRYGETDKMGIVYYANYLTWFEVARSGLCRTIGYPVSRMEEDGVVLPVVEARCRYRRSARYDELIRIETVITEMKPHSISFSYRVLRDEDDVLLAEGMTRHGFCDHEGKLVKNPQPFMDRLKSYLSKDNIREEVVSYGR